MQFWNKNKIIINRKRSGGNSNDVIHKNIKNKKTTKTRSARGVLDNFPSVVGASSLSLYKYSFEKEKEERV